MTMAGTIINPQRLVPGLLDQVVAKPAGMAEIAKPNEPKFTDMMTDMIQSVNGLQKESSSIQQAFLAGEPVELHQVMIKAEEAGLSFDLLLEIRNKLVAAYNEIVRMPM
jgi:flagellar hook-basal body complex protein FliE